MRERNYAIDLLRCICMFMVCCCHGYYHGLWAGAMWGCVFSVFTYWHVPAFVSISGWYGIRFSWRKFFGLWGVMAFYTFLSVMYRLFVLKQPLSISMFAVTGGWFGGAYLMLMLVAPFVNSAIECLVEKGTAVRLWSLAVLACVLSWLGFLGVYDPARAHTCFMALLFIYVTARIASLSKVRTFLSQRRSLIIAAMLMFVLTGLVAFLRMKCGIKLKLNSYYYPPIWIMGLTIVGYVAQSVKIPLRFGRIIHFLSMSMFGVLLAHEGTSFGPIFYQKQQQYLAMQTDWHPFVIILIAAASTFVCGVVLDFLRRGGVGLFALLPEFETR